MGAPRSLHRECIRTDIPRPMSHWSRSLFSGFPKRRSKAFRSSSVSAWQFHLGLKVIKASTSKSKKYKGRWMFFDQDTTQLRQLCSAYTHICKFADRILPSQRTNDAAARPNAAPWSELVGQCITMQCNASYNAIYHTFRPST